MMIATTTANNYNCTIDGVTEALSNAGNHSLNCVPSSFISLSSLIVVNVVLHYLLIALVASSKVHFIIYITWCY